MHPILAMLIGVAITVLLAAVSYRVAKDLSTSRMQYLQDENALLMTKLQDATQMAEILIALKDATDSLEKLDTTVGKLVDISTGRLQILGDAKPVLGRSVERVTDRESMSDLQSGLPPGIDSPT